MSMEIGVKSDKLVDPSKIEELGKSLGLQVKKIANTLFLMGAQKVRWSLRKLDIKFPLNGDRLTGDILFDDDMLEDKEKEELKKHMEKKILFLYNIENIKTALRQDKCRFDEEEVDKIMKKIDNDEKIDSFVVTGKNPMGQKLQFSIDPENPGDIVRISSGFKGQACLNFNKQIFQFGEQISAKKTAEYADADIPYKLLDGKNEFCG